MVKVYSSIKVVESLGGLIMRYTSLKKFSAVINDYQYILVSAQAWFKLGAELERCFGKWMD